MADGNIISKVKRIIDSDIERKFIVVSAPGKRYSGDVKITDLLYRCHEQMMSEGDIEQGFGKIRERFTLIAKELNLKSDFSAVLDETMARIEREQSEDFTASRGEYLCARIVAEVLDAKFIDAEDVILFKENGSLDGEKSYRAVAEALNGVTRAEIGRAHV